MRKTKQAALVRKTVCAALSLVLAFGMVPSAAFAVQAPARDGAQTRPAARVLTVSGLPLSAEESDLDCALKDGSDLAIAAIGEAAWIADTESVSAGGRVYAAGEAGAKAEVRIHADAPGWLIFDWKLMEMGGAGTAADSLSYALTGATTSSASIAADDPEHADIWTTEVVPVKAGDTRVIWTCAGAGNVYGCLDQIRFAAAQTPVAAIAGAGIASVGVKAAGSEVAQVDPGTEVAFSCEPAVGFLFDAWEAAGTRVSADAAYTVAVYDEPLSLTAVGKSIFDGTGTEDDPYLLQERTDLIALDGLVSGGQSFAGTYFKIESKYPIRAYAKEPFDGIGDGSAEHAFCGVLDGNGILISGMEFESGFVTHLGAGGALRNLVFECDAASADGPAGMIAGQSEGTIENCTAQGAVQAAAGSAGGIVGVQTGGSIAGCSTQTVVSAQAADGLQAYAGGTAGAAEGAAIVGCKVLGPASAVGADCAAGGIAGKLAGGGGSIGNCMAQTAVGGARAGGIVGWLDGSASVADCLFDGVVTAEGPAGGIVGSLTGASGGTACASFSACLASGSVVSRDGAAGGVAGLAAGAARIASSIALQERVSGASGAVHRVVGQVGQASSDDVSLEGLYAYADLDAGAVSASDANGSQGADVAQEDLQGDAPVRPFAAWEQGEDAWTITPGAMPYLTAHGPLDWPLYIQKADFTLDPALKTGSDLILAGDAEKWSIVSEDGRDYAAGLGDARATIRLTTAESGWLLFDWRYDVSGSWKNKFTCTLSGSTQAEAYIGANSSSNVGHWTCAVIPVNAGVTTIVWSAEAGESDTCRPCLDEVRFTTSRTPVAVVADEGVANAMAKMGDEEVSAVDPGATVAFSGAAAPGYVFAGWKASADATEFQTTAGTCTVQVYDEPFTLYAKAEKPFAGSGTEADPFLLGSRADLERLHGYVAGNNAFAGVHFALSDDIDCGEESFTPIGYISSWSQRPFKGSLDGRGHTVTFASSLGGLFGSADGIIDDEGNALSAIQNLKVVAAIDAAKASPRTGAVANSFTGLMRNVEVSGSVSASVSSASGTTGIGGLVGTTGSLSAIQDCTCSAAVDAPAVEDDNHATTGPTLGGIVGQTSYGTRIERCTVAGSVGSPESASRVGGIAGRIYSTDVVVRSCAVTADVAGYNDVGGIVGHIDGGGAAGASIESCEFFGNVSAKTRAGGIAGYAELGNPAAGITNNLVFGSVSSAEAAAGGIAGCAWDAGRFAGNVVLCQSVTGAIANRVFGTSGVKTWVSYGEPELAGNHAWAYCKVNGSLVAPSDAQAVESGLSGAMVGGAELQDAAAVPACYGGWEEAGWAVAAGAKPRLGELAASTADYPAYLFADYGALDEALARAEALDRDPYTPASLSVLDEAVAAVERGLPAYEQERVDAMAAAVASAIENLVVPTAIDAPEAQAGLVYTGTAQAGVPEGEGYALSDGVATDAGEYTAIAHLGEAYVWADGTYDDKQIAWSIAPAPVTVAVIDARKAYGAADPVLTAAVEGIEGVEGGAPLSYTLEREPGEAIGTYAIAVVAPAEANPNYLVQSVAGTFTIEPADIAQAAVAPIAAQVRTGTPLTPAVSVTLAGRKLVAGTDFDAAYAGNIEPGTARVTLTGKGNYTGSVSATFAIVAPKIAIAAPKAAAKLVYTGRTLTGVTAGAGYTLSGATAAKAGGYKATATLKDGYVWSDGTSASKVIAWSIAKAANPLAVKKAAKTLKLAKVKKKVQTFKPAVVKKKGAGTVRYALKSVSKKNAKSKFSVKAKTGKIMVKKDTAKGTYVLTLAVKAAGNANYKAAAKTVKVTVKIK